MGRLAWTETLEGWKSGRYRIELAAPGLWVLSRMVNDGKARVEPVEIIRTGGSLSGLKLAAAELESRRARDRRIFSYFLALAAVLGVAIVGSGVGFDVTVPCAFAGFVLSLRLLVIWVEMATGNPWSRIADTYQ